MNKLWISYRNIPLMWKISIGFILGIGLGFILGPDAKVFQPLGDLFLRLLKFIVIPMILFTLISGVNQTNPSQLGRMGSKVLIYYIFTSALALVIGVAVAYMINPGVGLSIPTDAKVDVPEAPSFTEVLLGIVPENIVKAFVELNLLSIIFVALVFGLAIGVLRHSESAQHKKWGNMLYDLSEAGGEASFRIMEWILQYSPVGIFALTAVTVGEQGSATLVSLLGFVGVVYLGIALQYIFYGLFLLLFGISPLQFFRKIKEATFTAFVTRSSLGTLPVTMNAAKQAGIRERLYSFSLPLGATMNMDGAALRVGASVIFAANVIDKELSFTAILLIIITGTLASVGTAGVPGAGLITLTTVLIQAGLPIEIVALIAAVDALLEMAATSLNVTGDLVGSAIVDKTEKKDVSSENV